MIPTVEKSDVRPPTVMPGLDPGIPTGTGIAKEAVTSCNGACGDGRVDPRIKSGDGHDGWGRSAPGTSILSVPGMRTCLQDSWNRLVPAASRRCTSITLGYAP